MDSNTQIEKMAAEVKEKSTEISCLQGSIIGVANHYYIKQHIYNCSVTDSIFNRSISSFHEHQLCITHQEELTRLKMDASKARDDLTRQLNQKSEECDKLNKDLDKTAKSVEEVRNGVKQKLESIAKEKDESLKKIKEESAAEVARDTIQ